MEANTARVKKMIKFLSTIKQLMYYDQIRVYMDYHIKWLLNVKSDIELLYTQNIDNIIDLKNFFKYPNEFFSEFIETYDDWMKMRYSLARTNKTGEIHINLEQYCRQFVVYLELILGCIYSKMTEKTIEKQMIINKLLNINKCFDLREEIKLYLFDDALVLHERFFNQKPGYYYNINAIVNTDVV